MNDGIYLLPRAYKAISHVTVPLPPQLIYFAIMILILIWGRTYKTNIKNSLKGAK